MSQREQVEIELLRRRIATTVDQPFTAAEKSKLAGIAAGAEVNPDVVPQAEAEAGVATTERIWTAERVGQAIAALGTGGGGGSSTVYDTDANLAADDDVHSAGQLVISSDTKRMFVGDGATAHTSLPDFNDVPIFIAAQQLNTGGFGSPSLSRRGSTAIDFTWVWLMSPTASEGIYGTVFVPRGWGSFVPSVHWVPTNTHVGDVQFQFFWNGLEPGSSMVAGAGGAAAIGGSSGTTDQVEKTSFSSVSVAFEAGHPIKIFLVRDAPNVTDTYNADIGVIGLSLERAS